MHRELALATLAFEPARRSPRAVHAIDADIHSSTSSNTIRDLYFSLYQDGPQDTAAAAHEAGQVFLETQLEAARALPCDLPADMAGLGDWITRSTEDTGRQYRAYLQARRQGAPRRFFQNKAHALHFLQGVAPTKLVDGSWLYGVLARWEDVSHAPLIRIYLEELGEGVPGQNHVLLYRQLLATHGCDHWQELPDAHFTQGAIQLALAHHAADFLPEVIGFNLGYEQLPLHLPITAYELNELGIDPYYFTLHVTVDNADSGHARQSLQALQDAWPRFGDRQTFYRRVMDGYRLNLLGASTTSVIDDFDLEQEVIAVLQRKSRVGQYLHSDYCRIAGQSVNAWLAQPARMPDFLQALQESGWIQRDRHPRHSRFWKLIEGEQAEMFGVFSAYERQLLADWIAGDLSEETPAAPLRPPSHRAQRRRLEAGMPQAATARPAAALPRAALRQPHEHAADDRAFSSELRALEEQLVHLPDRRAQMALLTRLMHPARHHTPAGLMATRVFSRLFTGLFS